MKKFITYITENPKRAIAFAIMLVVVVLLIYFFGKKFIDYIKGSINERREEREEDEIIEQSGGATYNNSEYNSMADSIFRKAGAWTWDDEDGIIKVFKRLQTNSDYLLLKKAWDAKDRDNYELNQFVLRYLSTSDIEKINDHFTTVGITYLF